MPDPANPLIVQSDHTVLLDQGRRTRQLPTPRRCRVLLILGAHPPVERESLHGSGDYDVGLTLFREGSAQVDVDGVLVERSFRAGSSGGYEDLHERSGEAGGQLGRVGRDGHLDATRRALNDRRCRRGVVIAWRPHV